MTGRPPEGITTARMIGEPVGHGNADELAPILFHPQVIEWLWSPFRDVPPTVEDFRCSIDAAVEQWEQHGFGYWLLRDSSTGEAVGRGGLAWTEVTGEAEVEVHWLIAPDRWGQGLATELAHAAVEMAFGTLALPELIAFALPQNLASRRVMEKAGFTYERAFEDEGVQHVLYRRELDLMRAG